jgi:hypothetical protein
MYISEHSIDFRAYMYNKPIEVDISRTRVSQTTLGVTHNELWSVQVSNWNVHFNVQAGSLISCGADSNDLIYTDLIYPKTPP